MIGVGNKRNGGGRDIYGELTWLVSGGGPGAAPDGQAAAGREPEHLVPGDVEGAEQLRVGEKAAQARHLRRRGVVHGGAARLRGVLGGLEVCRAGEQLLQARRPGRRGHAVRGARRARGAAGQTGGGGVAGGEDEEVDEERGEARAPTHRRRRRWRGTITGSHGRCVGVTMRGSGNWRSAGPRPFDLSNPCLRAWTGDHDVTSGKDTVILPSLAGSHKYSLHSLLIVIFHFNIITKENNFTY
jgi:hypothetical protein